MGGADQCQTKGFCSSRGTRENAPQKSRAETFRDAEAKQRMLELSVKYEKLAERLEQAATDKT
jgi:hypothetical protein